MVTVLVTVPERPWLSVTVNRTVYVPGAGNEFDVVGLAFPGVPGVPHFGHAGEVAWGITNAMAHGVDVFRETLRRTQAGFEALGPDGWRATDLRRSTIESVLATAGRSCTLELVDDPAELAGKARSMAARATAEGGILVAAGGDGTINTVAHEAVLAGCPFGVLPQGTFNYFGRTHGIPEDLAEAVYALLRARMRPVSRA